MLEFTASCDMPEIAAEFPGDQWEIYMATCAPSGKAYIGLTKSGHELRWYHHVRNARIRRRTGVLHSAIHKHGANSFTVEVLYVANSEREAIAVERGLIAQYGTMHPNGYNLTSGGETFKGFKNPRRKVSEKQIAHLRRLAAAQRGTPRNPAAVAKGAAKLIGKPSPMLGRRHSSASLERMRAAQQLAALTRPSARGKKLSEEVKANMSAAQLSVFAKKGCGHNKGKTMPQTSDALKRVWADPEYKAKMCAARRDGLARRKAAVMP